MIRGQATAVKMSDRRMLRRCRRWSHWDVELDLDGIGMCVRLFFSQCDGRKMNSGRRRDDEGADALVVKDIVERRQVLLCHFVC